MAGRSGTQRMPPASAERVPSPIPGAGRRPGRPNVPVMGTDKFAIGKIGIERRKFPGVVSDVENQERAVCATPAPGHAPVDVADITLRGIEA